MLRDIYATHLQHRLRGAITVVNFGAGSNNTARELRNVEAHLKDADADYLVMHFGIVDCAPRLMTEFERLFLGACSRVRLLGPVSRAYVNLKGRHRLLLTRWFPRVQVPLANFTANIDRLVAFARAENPIRKVFIVNIAHPGSTLTERSYGIMQNVRAYNAALESLAIGLGDAAVLVDVYEFTRRLPDGITRDDGYHIMPSVHAFIADTIGSVVAADAPAAIDTAR